MDIQNAVTEKLIKLFQKFCVMKKFRHFPIRLDTTHT